MLFVGVDWAEDHHDVCVMAEDGKVLAKRRVPDRVAGIGELHALIAEHANDDEPIVVGVELDRGLLVGSLLAAGYQVFAINPMASARYRDRHAVSGPKSDPGDAKVLADLVRTDRHNHRPVAGDSELAEGVKLLARAHQNAIWGRQRQLNALRSALREYYPGALEAFGTDLSSVDAIAILEIAPTPELVLSLPGLGTVLGARVLGEFGDDRTRFSDAKSRKNYAGTSPITKASGHSRAVLARYARNRRLGDACEQWAFCTLTRSPGAKRYYDELRARGKTHRQALRQLANRLVGLLHFCLERGVLYDELVAWQEKSSIVS